MRGEKDCGLKVLEDLFNVTTVFSEANKRIVMKGLRDNVRQCKAYVEFQMSVRRWWDEQDEKDRRFNQDEKRQTNKEKS